MPEIEDGVTGVEEEEPVGAFPVKRVLWAVVVGLVVVGLAVVPPLVNVSQFQRRIAVSISESMGRPVRIDAVKLRLLPLPGFELENFVVAEDPAFGAEPVMRANTVRATLRVSSLWRRKVEFSTISLVEPSVNLVHLADGRWNLESILVQAARIEAAPTGQATVSEAPRFPYIEATDARVNLKRGAEKLPYSLTEAKFALWLAQPDRWQVRVEAHPARTDTNVTDTGLIRLDGTLGRAAAIAAVPVEMEGSWSAAPLGAVSWMVLGEDAGLRGAMELTASVKGTIGENKLTARLKLKGARRAEFVPADPLDVDLGCEATAKEMFHALTEVRCAWPPDAVKPGLVLTGAMPEVLKPSTGVATLEMAGVPASNLVDVLRVASGRTPTDLNLTGALSGKLTWPAPVVVAAKGKKVVAPVEMGELAIPDAVLTRGDAAAYVKGPVTAKVEASGLTFAPVAVDLGGAEPATLEVTLRPEGYGFHLKGEVVRSRVLAFGAAIPQVGDGLEAALGPVVAGTEAFPVDLVTTRTWGGSEPWAVAEKVGVVVKRRGRRR